MLLPTFQAPTPQPAQPPTFLAAVSFPTPTVPETWLRLAAPPECQYWPPRGVSFSSGGTLRHVLGTHNRDFPHHALSGRGGRRQR